MILCHCHVVTDHAITAAVEDGARTLSGVCRATRAGSDCGSCVFSVKRTMVEAEEALARVIPAPTRAAEVA